MSEKRWTQDEVDAIVLEVKNELSDLGGLTDEQVAEKRASIEKKYGLSPGMLSRLNLSTGEEAEKQKIYEPHYEVTMEEAGAMTMEQYEKWSDLGAHVKQPPDIEAEESARAQAEENEKIDKMSMAEYVAYWKEKELKAEQEKEAAAQLVQEEQREKRENLRHKNPEEMTMEEYAAHWEARGKPRV